MLVDTAFGIGYSAHQAERLVAVMAESLHESLKPIWVSAISKKDMVSVRHIGEKNSIPYFHNKICHGASLLLYHDL